MLRNLFCPLKWIPYAQFSINRHTTCKICTMMTLNGTAGYELVGQNAPTLIMTSEMKSSWSITWASTCITKNVWQGGPWFNILVFLRQSECLFWSQKWIPRNSWLWVRRPKCPNNHIDLKNEFLVLNYI